MVGQPPNGLSVLYGLGVLRHRRSHAELVAAQQEATVLWCMPGFAMVGLSTVKDAPAIVMAMIVREQLGSSFARLTEASVDGLRSLIPQLHARQAQIAALDAAHNPSFSHSMAELTLLMSKGDDDWEADDSEAWRLYEDVDQRFSDYHDERGMALRVIMDLLDDFFATYGETDE